LALIVFDLDGTLAHTAPDLLGTLNRITEPFGLDKLGLESVGHIVGRGAKAMIARAFELNGKSLESGDAERLFDAFLKDYSHNIANETRLFPGAETAMDGLQAEGHRFALCTNKREVMARLLLEKLGMLNRFEALTGGDTFPFNKPDGRHIAETVRLAGFAPQDAIMVGDSIADIDGAQNAKIPCIAVTFGYSDVAVKDLGPQAVIECFSQLPQTVANLLSSK